MIEIKRLVNSFTRLLLPWTCVLCHDRAENRDLCLACAKELPWLTHVCSQCSLPLTNNSTSICGICQQHPHYYDHTIALFHYADPLTGMISGFKFHKQLLYANLFSGLLKDKLAQLTTVNKPDCLIPVPLHPSRLRKRGYNQALELARPLAKAFKLQLDYRNLKRTRATEQQSLIHADKRKANVKNAFSVTRPINAKHVVLIDDVITTGHTVNECARVLKIAGVEKVSVWAIARTSI